MKISQTQRKKLKAIGKKHNIKLAMVFGSQAKGILNYESDLDIAINIEKPKIKYKYYFGELIKDFSEVFGDQAIDLVDLTTADFLLKYEIYLNSQLIIGNHLDYCEFRARSYKTFEDSQDLLRLQDILLNKKHNLLRKEIYA